jgi:cyclic-di-AMP phosphodiesterase PgpH
VQLARKYRLPASIIDFIREHHGTLVTRYQYARALEAAGNDADKVDLNLFRYPGPRPQTRETALLMLADGCQARARAELPGEEFELRAVVRKVIDYCQHENQLDDTRLTLSDLNQISESFIKTLQNTYHPRIRYPEIKTLTTDVPTVPLPAPTLPELPAQTEPAENDSQPAANATT